MILPDIPLANLLALALLLALQIADILTTLRAIELGGREINPVMAWLMRRAGVPGALAVGKLFVLALAVGWLHDSLPALLVLDAVFAAIVANNVRVLRRMRRGSP